MVEQLTPEPGRDHRGSRRLSGRETVFWYSLAAGTYLPAALLQKGLLNWIVGPGWLVAVVVAGPVLVDRARGRA